MPKLISLLLSTVLLPALALCADGPEITEAALVRRTQGMLDSLTTGDQRLWKLFIADDALIFDEKGNSQDKRALLGDVQQLPLGYALALTIKNPVTRFAPKLAILSYDSDETETIFGQELHARYHTTDTWLYRSHRWQIIADQTLRYYQDPAIGSVPSAEWSELTGAYELTAGVTLIVSQKAGALYAQRGSGEPYSLLPESPDLFFRPGAEGRYLFHRLASGSVDALVDRRNNEDLVWKKLP